MQQFFYNPTTDAVTSGIIDRRGKHNTANDCRYRNVVCIYFTYF